METQPNCYLARVAEDLRVEIREIPRENAQRKAPGDFSPKRSLPDVAASIIGRFNLPASLPDAPEGHRFILAVASTRDRIRERAVESWELRAKGKEPSDLDDESIDALFVDVLVFLGPCEKDAWRLLGEHVPDVADRASSLEGSKAPPFWRTAFDEAIQSSSKPFEWRKYFGDKLAESQRKLAESRLAAKNAAAR